MKQDLVWATVALLMAFAGMWFDDNVVVLVGAMSSGGFLERWSASVRRDQP